MSDFSDEKLASLVNQGYQQHFSELYARYIDPIYRFIFISLRHKETAEDITSKVFVKVFQNIGTYRAESGSFRTWLYSIARNALVDYYRSAGREQPTETLPELPYHQGIEAGVDTAAMMKKLDDALSELDQELRYILIMRLWDGIPFSEISRIMGKSESAVKMAFYRAIKKLREILTVAFLVALTNRGYAILQKWITI